MTWQVHVEKGVGLSQLGYVDDCNASCPTGHRDYIYIGMATPQLLDLPGHILHPPTHPNHIVSLYTSFLSVKRCLNIELHAQSQGLDGSLDVEGICQAWTMLAEIGMMILGAELDKSAQGCPDWARNVPGEVEHAIAEGLKLSLTSRVRLLISVTTSRLLRA